MPPKKAPSRKGRKLTVERDIIEGHILAQLKHAGFFIESTNFKEPVYDAVAKRNDYGRTRTYGIHIKFDLGGPPLKKEEVAVLAGGGKYDEDWIIAESFEDSTKTFELMGNVRLFTLNEFELQFRDYPGRQTAPRATAARAGTANYAVIKLSTEALVLLLDRKIADIQKERPNSDEKITERDRDLRQFQSLRQKLAILGSTATDFHAGKAEEAALTAATKSFADDVKLWWTKNHEKICDKAYDMSMFLSAVTICSLAKADGNVAVVVSAALVGGKPVADVLKGLGKKVFG